MSKKDLLNGKKVLVVDDELDILELVQEQLPMCTVSKASSFTEAKQMLETNYYDLAILDIMGVDGYKLLEIANRQKVTAVMLTAHALSPGNVVKSYKGGAASYLPKEKLAEIQDFLEDIFEAKKTGKHAWWNWYDRLSSFFEKKFGPNWREEDKDFWKNFGHYV